MEKIDQLLEELSQYLDLDLHREYGKPIRIKIERKFPLHIEVSQNDELLFIIAISEIPAGRFRENVLKEGLKDNHISHGIDGILSYVEQQNMLMLHKKIPIDTASVEILVESLERMITKAITWHDALAAGMSSPHPSRHGGATDSRFGLR